ncbi:DnaJ domain-containing protein [Ferrovibrio sp.]|uniref:DnaJ domain-containing protein n=1 Tax=Ferrovibrio sp. TaxID=1917215 RepID=UPI0035B46CA0
MARNMRFVDPTARVSDQAEGAEPHAHARACEFPGCQGEGLYPAPKSREPRDGKRWFCLAHVRQYNAGWDFFKGMSRDDVERYQRADPLGHRPTWPLGSKPASEDTQVWVRDDLGILADVGVVLGQPRRRDRAEAVFHPQEREALLELGFDLAELRPPLAWATIKAQYKQMVKKYHPDANGGDRDAEERLKSINQAYAYLESRGYT